MLDFWVQVKLIKNDFITIYYKIKIEQKSDYKAIILLLAF